MEYTENSSAVRKFIKAFGGKEIFMEKIRSGWEYRNPRDNLLIGKC